MSLPLVGTPRAILLDYARLSGFTNVNPEVFGMSGRLVLSAHKGQISIRSDETDEFIRLEVSALRQGALYDIAAQFNKRNSPIVIQGPVYPSETLVTSRSFHLWKVVEVFLPDSREGDPPTLLKLLNIIGKTPWGIEVGIGVDSPKAGRQIPVSLVGPFQGAITCYWDESGGGFVFKGPGLNQLLCWGPEPIPEVRIRPSRCSNWLIREVGEKKTPVKMRDVASAAICAAHAGGLVFAGAPKSIAWGPEVFIAP